MEQPVSLLEYHRTFIYVLKDPETGAIKYVGKSDDPQFRLYHHRCDAKTRPRNRRDSWIKSLAKRGLEPELFIIEECARIIWDERERYWIAHYRAIGCDLVNHTDGGEGLCNPSPEVRA